MLPDFGYALYVEFQDKSKALVAWSSDKRALEDSAPTFARAVTDDFSSMHIVASHRINIVQDEDLPYSLEISGLGSQPEGFADPSVQPRLQSYS
jgi:hypothetical protein